jgi:AcrR family transcriptional regulator
MSATAEQATVEPEEGDGSTTPSALDTDRRHRGRRPGDAEERRRRVLAAIADLESVRLPFTMTDVAERAGISRATLYRDAGLRDLVGAHGDGPAKRPVDRKDYDALQTKAEALAQERRALRRALRGLEERVQTAEHLVDELKADLRAVQRERNAAGPADGNTEKMRKEVYAEGFAAGVRAAAQRGGGSVRGGNSGSGELLTVASRLPKASLQAARRTLARQLHPDLFTQDPAAAMLATELLKQINALVGPGSG